MKTPLTLGEVGEDRLVAVLTRGLPLRESVRVGAGDDCAVLEGSGPDSFLLLKTDAVLEGVHFLAGEDAARVGWKALCRAISDIAAMGGVPEHALVTLAVAPQVELQWVRGLYRGLKRAARKFGVAIVGGETCRSPGPVFLNIALSGSVERSRCVLRSGGRVGDLLYVTGRLGGSIAGKHLDFTPRVEEARWLTQHFPIRAMMDLSDGIGSDLPRLAAASGCAYTLLTENIPCSSGSTITQALQDGEDFELLLAVAAEDAAPLECAWKNRFPKLPLTRIGCLKRLSRKTPQKDYPHGFDHFA